MRAAVYQRGFNEPVVIGGAEKPAPAGDEVLVRVLAATVSASDAGNAAETMAVSRLMAGPRRPKEPIGGVEFAGVVETVGSGVRRFRPGDRVAGSSLALGAWAEYVRVRETGTLEPMPPEMDYDGAAGLCDGGITAWLFLTGLVKLAPGCHVLINGASGSVGTVAVQVARAHGAVVTAVCGPDNIDLVRSLGADTVVDYTLQDFTGLEERFDVVFDTVAKSSFARCKRLLKPDGAYLTTSPSPGVLLGKLLPKARGGKKALFMAAGLARPARRNEALATLLKLAREGRLRPVVDRRYPLEQITEALRFVRAGHKKGNVILCPQPV